MYSRTSIFVCLFVEWVGTEAFYGLAPTTAGPLPNHFAYNQVIITSSSPRYRQVTTLIFQGHIWAQGTQIFKGTWTFSLSF